MSWGTYVLENGKKKNVYEYTVGSEKLFCMSSNLLKSMSPLNDFVYNSKWYSYTPNSGDTVLFDYIYLLMPI